MSCTFLRAFLYSMKKGLGCFFLLLLFIISCKAKDVDRLEEEIYNIMTKYHAVGASVAVVKDNEIIYNRAFGYNPDYNDTTLRKPIPTNGVYVIASISKSFIATAIMQLVEKKLLSIDDDVNNYLDFNVRNPQHPDTPITVRMLLNHRSSINDKYYGWNLNQINPKKGKKWKECYNGYQPGAKFLYCNLNYNLLGAIIEKASDQRFFDFIDENIITPLGLYASYNLTKIDSARLVKAYKYDSKHKRFKPDPSIYNYHYFKSKLENYKLGETTACFSPSGGMKISATDLAKYMMMHINYGEFRGKRILSKKSEQEMWSRQGVDTTYALGFFRDRKILHGESVVGVRGSAHGVHSIMLFNPEKKFGIVVLCNGCTADRKMKEGIAWSLYKHLIKED